MIFLIKAIILLLLYKFVPLLLILALINIAAFKWIKNVLCRNSLALRNMHIDMSEKRGQFLPIEIFFYPAWSAMGTTYLLKDWWFLGIMGIAILDQIISLHSRTSCFWLKWLSTGFEGLLNISYKVLTIVYIVLIFSVICRKNVGYR